MKFSENWLREWVNPALTSQQLSEQLSMAGLEVDDLLPVAEQFTGVVVGEVVECAQHPDANKLRVTKINVGGEELLDIVCGAPNCRQGLKVAVATVGAVLPGNFKIKKAKLRGAPSFGMLCSFSELGMGDDHDGIMELPADAPLGTDLREYLNLDDQTVDIDLTPNRADCLSIRGIAREVGVLNQLDVNEPVIEAVSPTCDDQITITLSAPDACPRYLGRVIKNVNVAAESPLWLKEKLRRSGIRSIDPIVDVTNYVLIELGHPMHAFDLSALSGGIDVRLAKAEEQLTLLDETTVTLKEGTLVIADEEKAVAMAGIFGGLHSGVTQQTQSILLESAFFSPDAIAGRARQYGLHTDASHRYERGVDPVLQRDAMERATALILAICGGEIGPIVEGVSPEHLPVRDTVTVRHQRLEKVLGQTYAVDTVTDCLTRLGMQVTFDGAAWQAQAPSYRFDIAIEEDLIEEVARVTGYNNVVTTAPVAELSIQAGQEAKRPLAAIKSCLMSRGYDEAITYSFVDPQVQAQLFPEVDGIVLPHPISADMSVMRVSLWCGLLAAASYNQKRQQPRVRLFETGLRFVPDADSPQGVKQEPMVAGVITGSRVATHWDQAEVPVDFFDAKADVEALFKGTDKLSEVSFVKAEHDALHPGMSASIELNGECVGWLGAIHPQFMKKLGLSGKVFVFELTQAALIERSLPSIQPVSRFPSIKRDIAITVKKDVEVGNILKYLEQLGVNQLVGLDLFDVYTGQGIETGYKSLALSITLQDTEKTLEDSEIQVIVDTIVNGLAQQFGASLRD